MVIECPSCKNPLKGKKEDKVFICYKCGTIKFMGSVTAGDYVNIGMAKYKFKDGNTEFITVFENEEQGEEFLNNVQKYIDDYKYCTVITSLETYKLV